MLRCSDGRAHSGGRNGERDDRGKYDGESDSERCGDSRKSEVGVLGQAVLAAVVAVSTKFIEEYTPRGTQRSSLTKVPSRVFPQHYTNMHL